MFENSGSYSDILVFTEKLTPRIRYVFNYLSDAFVGVKFIVTTDARAFAASSHPRLNYSVVKFDSNIPLTVYPNDLMTGDNVDVEPKFDLDFLDKLLAGKSKLASVHSSEQDIPAFIFFCLSRFEEYLSHEKDENGAYASENSVLSRMNWLKLPVVEILHLKLLSFFYPETQIRTAFSGRYQFIPSIDVDNAYAYAGRPWYGLAGGMAKDLTRFNLKNFIKRIQVVLGFKRDPFDVYDFLLHSRKALKGNLLVFFLAGERSRYDRNLDPQSPLMRKVIGMCDEHLAVGLHPSYYSGADKAILESEKNKLESVLNKPIEISRQHYLRFNLPHSYENLIESGIKADYSMGYTHQPGFRAGTCRPFRWFNLRTNEETTLMVYPCSIMEATLIEFLFLNAEEGFQYFREMIAVHKEFGGVFIPVFHVHYLQETGKWKEWRTVFSRMIELAGEN
ncbi:MAG TPA: polysaccharide deacetylase family protein [Parasegetibacter sp.]